MPEQEHYKIAVQMIGYLVAPLMTLVGIVVTYLVTKARVEQRLQDTALTRTDADSLYVGLELYNSRHEELQKVLDMQADAIRREGELKCQRHQQEFRALLDQLAQKVAYETQLTQARYDGIIQRLDAVAALVSKLDDYFSKMHKRSNNGGD